MFTSAAALAIADEASAAAQVCVECQRSILLFLSRKRMGEGVLGTGG